MISPVTPEARASCDAPQPSAMGADGRLPLVIGVTGHRGLRDADMPNYRARVGEFFDDLQRRYPATPLRVLSALAAGADRLVAQIALERGIELIVPLPLEPADYERDFPDSVDEFRSLLRQVPAERVFVWPPHQDGNGTWYESPASRDRRYAEAGAFVADHCHILLAIWDGLPAEPQNAGTAAVVARKLGRLHDEDLEARTALDPGDSGPVFHVHAERPDSDAPRTREVQWRFPEDSSADLFDTVCARLDRFNAELARARVADEVPAAGAALLPGVTDLAAGDAALATAFAYADRLAAHYQRITHRVLRLTLLLAATMALIFEIYAEVLPVRIVPVGYLLCFALLTVVLFWHRGLDAQGRYLDYRALAEGLRVQFYWRLGGLADNAAASYLRKQLDELRWIREGLRAAGAAPPPPGAQPGLALRCWVHGQMDYYAARARLHERRLERIEHWSGAFLVIGLLATTSLVLLWNLLERRTGWHRWTVLIMGFAPIAAALWEVYGERIGARAQANQYARLATIFDRAERYLSRLEQRDSSLSRHQSEQTLLRELGHEALIENADWVLLLRDRPIALPKG